MGLTTTRQIFIKRSQMTSYIRALCKVPVKCFANSSQSEFALESEVQDLQIGFTKHDELYKYVFKNDKLSPAAKVYILRNKINTKLITPTGKNQRITKEDVIKYLANRNATHENKSASPKIIHKFEQPQREDMVKKFDTESRKRMMTSMTDSKLTPYFVYNDEYDITKLLQFQKDPNMFPKEISMLAVVIKSLSIGIISFPMFNKTVHYNHLDEVEIMENQNQNICIAHSESNGLTTSCISKIETLKITDIQDALPKVLDPLCKCDPINMSTFSLYFNRNGTSLYPNILRPHSCAFAFGQTRHEGRFDSNGMLVPKELISISISCDPRVIHHKDCANFSNLIKLIIENPMHLSLHMH